MKVFVDNPRSFIKHNIPLLIFLIAFAVRLNFIIHETDIPSSDAASYDSLGLSIAEGHGYVDDNGVPDSFRPPFYPAFLAVIYKFFGHNYFAVRFIQATIGALTSVFIFLIGSKIHSFFVGISASFVSIGYLPFIKSASLLLTENIFTFILILIIFYLLRIQREARWIDSIMLGLLLGISLLTKSVMLLFALFIIPVFIYSKNSDFIKCLKKYTIVLLFLVLVISPWVIRNYIIYDRFIPVSSQGGIGFYSSYCPPNGVFGRLATNEDPVIKEANSIKSPALQNDFLIKETLNFILNNPRKVLILELKKIVYLWAPFDWEIVGNRWFNFIYLFMLPFFAIGFLLTIKEFRRFYPILIPIIYFQIISLIFYGSPRFRLPIEPYIFILGMIGIVGILEYFKTKKTNKNEHIISKTL